MAIESHNQTTAFTEGLATRRQVMGDDFVDRALARAAGTESDELQHFVTEHVWGAIWNRPGLTRRDRSLLNIGILTALRAHEELIGHVRGALTNGLSREEIVEAIIHTSGYCGAPAALSAMRSVQQVFDQEQT
ncbi:MULTISPECIES: carboxymuconolactone decarboxylase family protein [unclassified Nocardia]|uniref:carboxymuconolactone decarboxylase family protein n=1 Tax=unclassified Nocardia TaxID=2637762 RepID=UPI0033ADC7F2